MSERHDTPSVNPRPVEHLYRLRGTSGVLLYVGITNNWPSRMKQHMADKPWWYEVAGVELVGVIGTRAQLESIERAVIKIEEPIYNVAHNRDVAPVAPPTQDAAVRREPLFAKGEQVRLKTAIPNSNNPGIGRVDFCRPSGVYSVTFPRMNLSWDLCESEIVAFDADWGDL